MADFKNKEKIEMAYGLISIVRPGDEKGAIERLGQLTVEELDQLIQDLQTEMVQKF